MKEKVARHQRFYFPPDKITRGHVSFPESESTHMIASLRLKKGDVISATDGKGGIYGIAIEEAKRRGVIGRVIRVKKVKRSGPSISLFQGVIRPSRMDLIVEKCVELGISGFVPVLGTRSLGRASIKRLSRLRRIAIEAMKQSLGAFLPEICSATSFDDALCMIDASDLVLVAWEEERKQRLRHVVKAGEDADVALWIGPEGGFTSGEIEALSQRGASTFSLGPTRLRSETAAIASVAALKELF